MLLASRGLRDLDQGIEPMADPEADRAVRRRAHRVLFLSFVATLLVAAAFALLP